MPEYYAEAEFEEEADESRTQAEEERTQSWRKPFEEPVDFVRTNWTERYQRLGRENLLMKKTALCAHNAVIDYVEFVTSEKIHALLPTQEKSLKQLHADSKTPRKAIQTPHDVLAFFLHSLRDGKAAHLICKEPSVFDWLEKTFNGPDKVRLGGQAGITAHQLAHMDARVTLVTPFLSTQQAALLYAKNIETPVVTGKKVAFTPAKKAGNPKDPTKINWILEFHRGTHVTLDGERIEAPRSNRVIISSECLVEPTFHANLQPFLSQIAKRAEAAFLAGYHYLDPAHEYAGKRTWKQVIKDESASLAKLKKANPQLFLHYEYVPFSHPEIEKEIVTLITQHVDSLGCNEIELRKLLVAFGFKTQLEQLERIENSFTLYDAMRPLFAKLKLKRFHLHTLGYHVVILAKPYPRDLEKARDAIAYGALAGTAKAMRATPVTLEHLLEASQLPVSETGLNQIRAFESALSIQVKGKRGKKRKEYKSLQFDARKLLREGIMDMGIHHALVVPAQIVPRPVATVGLGDVVSSFALVAEQD